MRKKTGGIVQYGQDRRDHQAEYAFHGEGIIWFCFIKTARNHEVLQTLLGTQELL